MRIILTILFLFSIAQAQVCGPLMPNGSYIRTITLYKTDSTLIPAALNYAVVFVPYANKDSLIIRVSLNKVRLHEYRVKCTPGVETPLQWINKLNRT